LVDARAQLRARQRAVEVDEAVRAEAAQRPLPAERGELPEGRVPVAARVVGERVQREDRVALAERDEVAPVGAELDERAGAPDALVGELAVEDAERAARRDVGRVAAVVGERHLMRPQDAALAAAPTGLGMGARNERAPAHLPLPRPVAAASRAASCGRIRWRSPTTAAT